MTIEKDAEPQSCGATIEQHIVDVYVGLQAVGAGLGCREVYRALVELAEAARAENNFDTYLPQGNGIVLRTIKAAVMRAKEKVAKAEAVAVTKSVEGGGADFAFPISMTKN